MFKCYRCGMETVGWLCDHALEDIGMEEQGIMTTYECRHCGAYYEVYITAGFEGPDDAVTFPRA